MDKVNVRFIPRVTDMRNGTFRPELVMDYGTTKGDIIFGRPVASYDEARSKSDLMSLIQRLNPEDAETAIIAVKKALKNDKDVER
jgi:hypothetical protein